MGGKSPPPDFFKQIVNCKHLESRFDKLFVYYDILWLFIEKIHSVVLYSIHIKSTHLEMREYQSQSTKNGLSYFECDLTDFLFEFLDLKFVKTLRNIV